MRAETGEVIVMSAARVATSGAPSAEEALGIAPAPQIALDPAPRRRFDMAAQPGVTRAGQIAATLDNAFADAQFREDIARADAARDNGDWARAEGAYASALRRFPLHWGYAIQYAHTVKEQGQFIRAEAWYRSAVAMGAPADMVDQHLAFVAGCNGVKYVRLGQSRLHVPPLLAPPTVHDMRLLIELTRTSGYGDEDIELDLMRTMPDNRRVLLTLFARPEFARANRAFLDIMRA
jgi:hypothetical protein